MDLNDTNDYDDNDITETVEPPLLRRSKRVTAQMGYISNGRGSIPHFPRVFGVMY